MVKAIPGLRATLPTPWLYRARVSFAIRESRSSLRLMGEPVARSNAIPVRIELEIQPTVAFIRGPGDSLVDGSRKGILKDAGI